MIVVDDAALVGGDVEIVEGQPVTVEGDPVALQRLFVNLVDNAVKYGRQARLSVRRDGDLAVVDELDLGTIAADGFTTVTWTARDLDGVELGGAVATCTELVEQSAA